MKLMVLLEVDVSATIAETIMRSGFTLSPDGTQMQVKVPNCPSIPQRKTQVAFVTNPNRGLNYLVEGYQQDAISGTDTPTVSSSNG